MCKSNNYWGYVKGAYKDTDGNYKNIICSNKIIRYTNKYYKNNLTQNLQYFINGSEDDIKHFILRNYVNHGYRF